MICRPDRRSCRREDDGHRHSGKADTRGQAFGTYQAYLLRTREMTWPQELRWRSAGDTEIFTWKHGK
jgi:hypothetical protein